MSKSGAVSVTGAGAGAGYDRYDRQFRPNLLKISQSSSVHSEFSQLLARTYWAGEKLRQQVRAERKNLVGGGNDLGSDGVILGMTVSWPIILKISSNWSWAERSSGLQS